ncbi:MAG: trypsin-like peptidase domain-containing protein, partial [Mogibacterium sp.]|nr:trypsin-like peptidase domain-containing protein [Mogibacterium sp.]
MDDNEKLYTGEGIIDNDEVTIIHPSQVIKNPEPTPPPGDSDSEIGFDDWKFGNPDDFLEKKEKKPKDSTPYVTKRFFAIAIIVVMIFSSAISSFVAVKMVGAARSYNNLSTNSLEKATGSKLTIAEIIALNQDSVVEITTSGVEANMFGQTQVVEGAGSGVIVNEKGYIVTNYHVVEGSTSVKVTLRNGKNHTASIVGSDPDNDIAVIKINATGLKAVTLGDSSKLAVGDMTVAIGNPLGQLGGTATQGIVS